MKAAKARMVKAKDRRSPELLRRNFRGFRESKMSKVQQWHSLIP